MARKAAIVGGGVIGGGWAARFLLMGWDVALFDPSEAARARVARVLEQARYALPMLYEGPLPPEGRLRVSETLEQAVAEADYIQESVSEVLDLKHRVLSDILAANPDAPAGSSTSGFTPSDLRAGLGEGAGRVLVAHPFNPVYLLPLVEIVGRDGAVPGALEAVESALSGIGMVPLVIPREIDAHVADRLLEAVWREALWLVRDDIATTAQIDDAIRLGFGLRWAQMGLFETYRIAGGDGGMAHFLAQFGPALAWPWTKLVDVPELTDALVAKIAAQSDAQSDARSIAELEAERDGNLVAILRALRARGAAAGRAIAAHEERLSLAPGGGAFTTVERTIPLDWTDYNGHMNESRYGQVFSDASDRVLDAFGAGPDYVSAGFSYFTVESTIRYLAETLAGERIRAETRITLADGKKLGLSHVMSRVSDGARLAEADQLLVHVSLETRRSCPPREDIAARLTELAAAHASDKV
ncbi:carnitine 3-dehydrogenase [Alphaproteobacteria bacterium GH1-50]|uniref:L-carnitine dehydrogenase n=1 Tax=Kangsaoukella pontilimi TaxID=2691042 RepID=A0A7C9J0U9_9RHOB|nr:carnitine 3-dehydrogenase [Kangsaoukella pontilimi]MXQ06381.1 carnitine 3-dehydrogenase [Kangsaoukella pontilimi]